ncbi:MAG: DnaJ domain-containing protein [Leptolyngbyaceae cyanobacterium SL_1_1]|nr:DnaJ domain-containing protein [Leptolyngbyaceae cyanobacterium RM1_1_2]NJO11833.1 DnaJ domain-containing protein [Leptolyngbyaceae cyanobacterium SL_1_1]
MTFPNHYKTLEITETATPSEIKRAYRRLAKRYHPDSNQTESGHEQIALINAAYEILGDPQQRSRYDSDRQDWQQTQAWGGNKTSRDRQQRTVDLQNHYRQQRQSAKAADTHIDLWLRQVYGPIDRLTAKILNPLKAQIRALSADPFDDELMAVFQDYLEDCRSWLEQARAKFASMPNPANAAGVAANLYYCLNQLEDGIEEMERFTYNYDDTYLHDGQELFRISSQLRREAKSDVGALR